MTPTYAEIILNSLSAHIAIIDKNGMIIKTNKAWQAFASSNQVGMRPDMLNVNYLDICDAAHDGADENARKVARGIRRVINGEMDEFVLDYPCHSPDEKRWFYMRAIRADGSDPLEIVISHENITALKTAEQKILRREEQLEQKTRRLEEANAALKALLRQRDEDLKEKETIFFQNLMQTVLPYFDQLKQVVSPGKGTHLIDLIESELKNIASPFLRQMSNLETVLTPQEIKIASMIRQGKSSKEIAGIFNLSMTTVNFHRRNLRDKLGLTNTAVNLGSFLRSLGE
ncbi:MAG: LuxR C-terminal-related transcriptional regulator [Desulfobacterales bacterium]|nr:LuxR C-terminal-related transcriptional regulator [Desulfobacterales bacterium]